MIAQAIAALRKGELVGLPTETVYGLAADARNEAAILKVFAAKGRPSDHPLIVHIGTLAELDQWACDIPQVARRLAEHFWPGPLTLILKKAASVSPLITGGQDTIAVRMPNHPLALKLLQEYGGALVAPSANRFGCISPTDEHAVKAELADQIACILPGGRTPVGIESTILDVHTHPFTLLRQGMLKQSTLETFLKEKIALPSTKTTLRAPGLLASHYAPHTPLYLLPFADLHMHTFASAIVLARQPAPPGLSPQTKWWLMPQDPDAYAYELYATLRRADEAGVTAILVETTPAEPAWQAICDRLTRASHRT